MQTLWSLLALRATEGGRVPLRSIPPCFALLSGERSKGGVASHLWLLLSPERRAKQGRQQPSVAPLPQRSKEVWSFKNPFGCTECKKRPEGLHKVSHPAERPVGRSKGSFGEVSFFKKPYFKPSVDKGCFLHFLLP